jgi:hypothetical protein
MRLSRNSRGALMLLVALLLASGSPSAAHETDQYSIRDLMLADSTEVLNTEFNRILAEIALDWTSGENPAKFATRVFKKMGGRHYIDKYERWALQSGEVDYLDLPKEESIYRGASVLQARVVFFFGIGSTIRVNDTLVGTDKIGHFLSLGWKYHRRYLRGKPEDKVVKLGPRSESAIFGSATTGVFSNADLVANYEGYLFYRSLFDDDVIPGKPAIIAWEDRGARVQRPFDWRDHVNNFWDEALNPSFYDKLIRRRVVRNLGELCNAYFATPERFVAPDDETLRSRYAHLKMRDTSDYRLDYLCEKGAEITPRPSSVDSSATEPSRSLDPLPE